VETQIPEYGSSRSELTLVMRTFQLPLVLAAVALIAVACGSATASENATAATPAAETAPPAIQADEAPEPADEAVSQDTAPEQDAAPLETADEADAEVEVAPARAGSASADATFGEDFPDIVAVQATQEDSGGWRFDVTVSSPYDTPARYADAWRVLDPDGNELGIRVLTHDHANEQPFTRSQSGIQVPDGVNEVTIQGRDLANGWGGGDLVVELS